MITSEEIKTMFPLSTEIKDNPLSLWEDFSFILEFNHLVDKDENSCKHCYTDNDKIICPIVVIARNEGGYNSTGTCFFCIQESIEKALKERIK